MNKSEEVLELLDKPVDVRKLMRELLFDLDGFEQANIRQPRLFLEAGRYLTWSVLQKVRAENKLETLLAQEGLKLRQDKINGKRSVTDRGIADLVNANVDVRKCKRDYALAKAAEVWAKQLLEAYNHRLSVLTNITKIRTGEMATELRAVKERAAIDTVRKAADRVRRSMETE